VAKPDAATALARRFCHALAEETAGMNPGSGRMVQTIAQRMGIPFDDASSIADDCARRGWVDHRQHTVSLREEGRMVAAAVRNAIVSKRQSPPEKAKAPKPRPRKR
jgi:class 3 adenylate cyclase